MPNLPILVGAASAFALISLGGAFYEFRVIDPAWPQRPELVQPARGGILRRSFWIPAHIAFELSLVAALIASWSLPEVRFWLLTGLSSHLVMRIWSAFDFIPKALALERADTAEISEEDGRRWTRRSLCRLPLDLVTCVSMLAAFATAARLS